MIRSLSALKAVWMLGIENEICAAVLEGEAAVFWDDCCAEATEVAVYEGGAVAVGVSYGKVDCVAVVVGWGTVIDYVGC